MAKGYPDYFGQSIWPKYGTPIYTLDSDHIIPSGGAATLLSISVTGILFSIDIGVQALETFTLSLLTLAIDGQMFAVVGLGNPYFGFPAEAQSPLLYTVNYNHLEYYQRIVLAREVPFHETIVLQCSNGTGSDMSVTTEAVHYVVT